MSAPQGCNDDMGVVESFKEALKGRVGADRYRMWFTHGVEFSLQAQADSDSDLNPSGLLASSGQTDSASLHAQSTTVHAQPAALVVSVRGQFALDRLRKNFLSEIRGAAMQACGSRTDVQLRLDEAKAHQVELPLDGPDESDQATQWNEDGQSNGDAHENSDALAKRGAQRNREDQETWIAAANNSSARSGSAHAARRRSRSRGKEIGRRGGNGRLDSTRSLAGLIDGGATHSMPTSARAASQRGARCKVSGANGQRSAGGLDPVQMELPEFDVDAVDGIVDSPLPSHPQDHRPGEPGPGSETCGEPTREKDKGNFDVKMTSANFIPGNCNRLAHTAMVMACQDPSTATPLFLCGPTGTGKTHLLTAIADQLRRRYRLRRVVHLSAEQFTNDFISSVGNSGITAFRRRYREVDALLVDDVQFLGSKKATLREMLYTVETLAGSGRPLIFAGSDAPTEINGLSRELAGRMASGLVCTLQPLDNTTREKLFRRWLEERCHLEVPDALIEAINPLLAGDGRVISGVVNVLRTLQRMLQRCPTLDEMKQFGGQLLRAARPMTTLGLIESAVCEAFQLPPDALRGKSQTRAITGPRMLAMYLSRQLTPAAYAEIARHFGGRSHSTAISAEQQVKTWLAQGGDVGRGRSAMSAREAIDRIESLLRTG